MAKDKLAEFRPEQKKVRKKRKPMTEEQRAAAGARLKLAREKRQAANPPTYAGIAPAVVALDDEDTFSLKNVREWIKIQKGLLSELNRAARVGDKGAIAKQAAATGYVRHMEAYLRCGDWIDNRYGAYAEHEMGWICTAMAYYADGTPKRTNGVYYPDLGFRWGSDPADAVDEMAGTLEGVLAQ